MVSLPQLALLLSAGAQHAYAAAPTPPLGPAGEPPVIHHTKAHAVIHHHKKHQKHKKQALQKVIHHVKKAEEAGKEAIIAGTEKPSPGGVIEHDKTDTY